MKQQLIVNDNKNIIFKRMGSTDSIPESSGLKLSNNNWRAINRQDLQQQPIQYGRYVRLKNQMTAQEINQYQLVFSDSDDYQQFIHVLNFRNSAQHLVHIRYFDEEKIHHLCSLLVNLKVYIDHFPLRISNVQRIPYPENLYVLTRALAGFEILYNQFGYFHITQDLICINEQGIIKIWLHPNLSKSYFQTPTGSSYDQSGAKHICTYEIEQKSTENAMIWQLLIIIDRLTNKQSLPRGVSFLQYLKKINKSQLNFSLAQQLLFSYAKENDCQIPEVFQSALKIIRQRKGIFDSQVDITQAKVKVQEIDLANLGSRFKESKVQRIQSVKNPSLKSQIASQSNHTFADKLKSFDRARAKMDVLGKSNLTPIKQNIVTIPQKKQPLTERVLGNTMSFSCLSSPQFQSLTAIGQQNRLGTFPTSSSHSQIIQKNLLTLSQSPTKQKPMTYFSQYINSTEQQIKMAKKPTIFSFGEAKQDPYYGSAQPKHKENLLTQGPITISLENSKNQVRSSNKPVITFTYNSNFMTNSEPQPHPMITILPLSTKNLQKSQSADLVDMPISPPSVDKKSSMFLEQAKQIQQNERQAQKNQNENMIETMMRRQKRQICQSFYTKAADHRQDLNDRVKEEENINQSYRGLDFGAKIEQSRDKPGQELIQESKQPLSPTLGQKQWDPVLGNPDINYKAIEYGMEKPIAHSQTDAPNPQMGKSQQIITNILLNQFDIDPDIVSDLLYYEQRKINKKRSKNFNKL